MDVKTVLPPNNQAQVGSSKSSSPQINSLEVPTVTVETKVIPSLEEHFNSSSDRDAVRYDPIAIAQYYSKRPLQVLMRRIGIVWPFLLFALRLWWDKKTGNSKKNQGKQAIQLREMLTQLGPAFIKIGQALSTRPDLVPPLYLEELTKLQDQLPAFPNEIAYRFIEEELGDRPENIYAELSPNPVAAASLGQVYKGKLKTGETVAVKVQRPGLKDSMGLDVYILRQLALWFVSTFKNRVKSDLVGIMDEFGARIYEEMDYTQEGRNAEKFQQLYGHIKDIYVPKIYWEYTGREVLTMEWVEGTKLTKLAELRQQGIDPTYLISVGVNCSLRQLLEHGFFHADPHPGNLLATTDGKLAYLDFGMMSQVKPHQRYGLIEAVVHLVNRDFEGLAKDYVKLEFLTEDTDLTPIVPALAGVFGNALGSSVAELNFKSITDQLSEVMYEYPFRVPAYYALIIRSLVTLEGIAINVDPEFKVLSKAYPYVAKRLLTDSAPELRSSLRDLLFKEGSFRWNRLENLLKNAKNSDDYDLSQNLNQALEFLFSERGDFIRDYLVDEIVKSVDMLSQNAFYNARSVIGEWFGLTETQPPVTAADQENLARIQRILQMLQDTPGFDPMKLVQMVPEVLMKPEVQRLGQQVASNLAQRAVARLIRQLLLTDPTADPVASTHNPKNYSRQAVALPPAR
jgi:predicted unusual protein kinase regulating ubiquinone biosynthesis (AarF/ABC1/UbiB family)